MSSMNGVLSPPPIIDPATSSMNLSSKRKREDSILDSESASAPEIPPAESQALIKDLIDVLKADDTTPSILTRSIPDLPRANGPQSKRPKAIDVGESRTSIISRLSANFYKTVDEVVDDIDAAVYEIADKLELPNYVIQNQCTAISRPPSELSVKITAFSKRAHDLVKKGKASWERSHKVHANGTLHSCARTSGQDEFNLLGSTPLGSKHVLTLFGNAPAPKQLFSSLQLPTKVNGTKDEVIVPIREVGLPNGIATTRIIPTHPSCMIDNRKRTQTLGDIFPTPSNLTPLIPPKPSAIATTKSINIGWYHPAPLEPFPKTLSYFDQGISSGQWVDYSKSSSSSRVNRAKHRDRILDLGINKGVSTEKETIDSENEKLEMLFRSAYSSFAPTKDNSAAIAPTGCLDRMWWLEVGERCFSRLVQDSNKIFDAEAMSSKNESEIDNDLKNFENGLEELGKNTLDPGLYMPKDEKDKPVQQKDVDEILEEISELLKTLTSYQRIRHLSLNTSNRSTAMLISSDSNSLGTPLKPSQSEIATYEILKSQLSLMIASLPPYAVAKINPDKLADLSISTKVEIKVNDYKGVMEEDESLTKTKMVTSLNSSITSPRPTPLSIHRSSSGNSSQNAHYGNQFASSQSRGPTSQYYNSVQTPIRAPSASLQRPPNTTPIPYQAQRTASAGPYRPNNYGMSSYSHQSARPIQQQYNSLGQQAQYSQTPPSQGFLRTPSQNYHLQHVPQPISQSASSNRYPSQPIYQSQSQTQSTQNGSDLNRHANNHQISRPASPQKAIYSPQSASPQSQPSQSASIALVSQKSQVYGLGLVSKSGLINGSAVRPSKSSPNHQVISVGASGATQQQSTFMTHEQQQSMMQLLQATSANQQQNSQQNNRDSV